MRKLFLLFGMVVLLTTACDKDVYDDVCIDACVEQEQSNPLEDYLIRVAEEGIAMLGNASNLSGNRREVDPSCIKAAHSSTTRSGESDVLYYVVNFADSAGFALINADTSSRQPLLAVTEKGNYTPGEVTNTGFDDYISMLSIDTSIKDSLLIPTLPPLQRMEEYEQIMAEVPALIPVQWDQGWPYNKFCPLIAGSNNNSAAGCVAIAIAQILAYHEYPDSYTMSWNGQNITKFIDWDLIGSHNACNLESCEADNEIALLIREIGHRSEMNYGQSSGTDVEEARDCLESFGYYRLGTRDVSWDLITSELNMRRPLFAKGFTDEGSGHAWLLDGYKVKRIVMEIYEEVIRGSGIWELISSSYDEYYFVHYNWGWGGTYDGYFYYGNYSPAHEYSAFSHDLELVPGIYPIPIE